MGIRITTDEFGVKVWRSDRHGFPQYAVKLGKKVDDKWVNEYQPIKFRKGIEIENGEEIVITDGFSTVDVWKSNGEAHGKQVWIVLDFYYKNKVVRKEEPSLLSDLNLDDLPDTFAAAEDDIPF